MPMGRQAAGSDAQRKLDRHLACYRMLTGFSFFGRTYVNRDIMSSRKRCVNNPD